MSSLILLLAVGLFYAAPLLFGLLLQTPRRVAFQRHAHTMQLTMVMDFIPRMRGTRHGLEVELSWPNEAEGKAVGVRYRVCIPGPSVQISPSSWIDRITGEVTLGDPTFDQACWIGGPASTALAMLSAEARSLLLPEVKQGASIRDGWVDWQAADAQEPHEGSLDRLCRIARALTVTDVTQALLERARQDPEPKVREQAGAALLRAFPASPQARDLATEWFPQAQGEEQARLAHLTESAAALAVVATSPSHSATDRRDALAALLRRPTLPDSITSALGHPAMDTIWKVSPAPLPMLRRVLAAMGGQPASRPLVERFCGLAEVEDEALLLELLRAQVDVQPVAIALERVGTRHALPGLHEQVKLRRLPLLHQVIKVIAARSAGMEGALSLPAGGEVGLLEEAGAVSPPEER